MTYLEIVSTVQCPRCHVGEQLLPVETLYETPTYHDDARFKPAKPLPEHSYLALAMSAGTAIEVITLAAIMVICASDQFSALDLTLGLVGIITPIVWSGIAFRRMLTAMRRARPAQEAYDEAMAEWHELVYCPTDDLVFDPRATTLALRPAFNTAA